MGRKTIASLEQTIVDMQYQSHVVVSGLERQIQTQKETIETNNVSNASLRAANTEMTEGLEKARGIFVIQKAEIKELRQDGTSTLDIHSAFDCIAEYMNQRGWGWDRDLIPPRMGNINLLAFNQGQIFNKFCYALSDVAVGAHEYHHKLAQQVTARINEAGTSHGGQTLDNLIERAGKAYNQRLACDELLSAAMDSHEKALERKFDVEKAKAQITARREQYQKDSKPELNQKEETKASINDRLLAAGIPVPTSTPLETIEATDPRLEDVQTALIDDYLKGIKSNAPTAELNTDGIQTSNEDVADMEDGHTHLTEQKGDPVLGAIAADGISTRAA